MYIIGYNASIVKHTLNSLKKALTCFLAMSMLFNPSFALLAFAQQISSSISPINEDNFVSGDVTVSANITDTQAPITSVTFTMFDYYEENDQSCSGEQGGDDGSNWACQIDTNELDDSNDELYDLAIDYEDEEGNSNTAYHSDNNDYFDIDNSPPQDPHVTSSSHSENTASQDNTIYLSLESADDSGSGVDGFSYSFTHESEDLPDEEKDIEEDVEAITSDELEDGSWYFHLRTRDNIGNWTSTVHLGPFIIDTTPPDAPTASPVPGDYTNSQEVALSSSDDISGVSSIYYTLDDTDPSNENGTLYENPIAIEKSTNIRAIAYDHAGNSSSISLLSYGIAPVISLETTTSTSSSSVTITWTTDDPSTSRVIYDTVSHPNLGSAPNYGYANSTEESDTSPKVTSHSVTLNGLSQGTTYYYRTISKGSPEAVGGEKSLTTSGSSSTSTAGGSSNTGTASAPSCDDQKPASAPTLLTAKALENSVSLTWAQGLEPVSYYLVAYGLTPGTLQFGNPDIGGKETTSFTVESLSGGTTYYFRVRAGNGCMPGDYSNELAATPFGGFVENLVAEGFSQDVLGTIPTNPKSTTSKTSTNPFQSLGDILAFIFSFIAGLFAK